MRLSVGRTGGENETKKRNDVTKTVAGSNAGGQVENHPGRCSTTGGHLELWQDNDGSDRLLLETANVSIPVGKQTQTLTIDTDKLNLPHGVYDFVLKIRGGGGTLWDSWDSSRDSALKDVKLEKSAEDMYQWTVLVYMDVRQDLLAAAQQDLKKMLAVTYDPRVAVRLMIDYPGLNDTQVGWIHSGRQFAPVPETGISPQDRLTQFLKESVPAAPARHYALALWSHGSGFQGFGAQHPMEVDQIRSAIENANVHLDLLGFSACLMGSAEFAYEFRNIADVYVASENVVYNAPLGVYDWTAILDRLSQNPTMLAKDLGQIVVSTYQDTYDGFHSDATMAAVDLKQMPGLLTK